MTLGPAKGISEFSIRCKIRELTWGKLFENHNAPVLISQNGDLNI